MGLRKPFGWSCVAALIALSCGAAAVAQTPASTTQPAATEPKVEASASATATTDAKVATNDTAGKPAKPKKPRKRPAQDPIRDPFEALQNPAIGFSTGPGMRRP